MTGRSKILRATAGGIAVILVAIFLSAKIPSSKCHCHDPEKSKKVVCPFGVLRTLTFVEAALPAPTAVFQILLSGVAVYSLLQLHGIVANVDLKNRDPPILRIILQ